MVQVKPRVTGLQALDGQADSVLLDVLLAGLAL